MEGKETVTNLSQVLQNNVNIYMQSFPKELFNDSYHDQIKQIEAEELDTNCK